jgi:hypothetical protein
MDTNGNSKNGSAGLPTQVDETSESVVSQRFVPAPESVDREAREEPSTKFATRAAVKGADGISKGKLLPLGGGLAVAVLFFVFTAVVNKSPKKLAAVKPPSQQSKQEKSTATQGSVTPVMDTVHPPAPDNSSGQLGPGDIRHTRSLENGATTKPPAGKPVVASSLGSVPSFAVTQQKWEDPASFTVACAIPIRIYSTTPRG